MGFERAFRKTVGLEGGLSLDPNDPGNWTGGRIGAGELRGTKYGISAARFPDEDIKNLTLERAKELYYDHYWRKMNLDAIANEAVQEEIFDMGVNMGINIAALILQRALNFLEPGKPVTEDGVIGPETAHYANIWCRKDPEALFRALNGFQFMRYFEIIKSDPTKKRYARGWMKRIQDYRSAE